MKTITITIDDEAYDGLLKEVAAENRSIAQVKVLAAELPEVHEIPERTVEDLLTEVVTTYATHGYVD